MKQPDILKKFVLKNFNNIKTLYENNDYEYVVTETELVFALAKENSGCVSCCYGNVAKFNLKK